MQRRHAAMTAGARGPAGADRCAPQGAAPAHGGTTMATKKRKIQTSWTPARDRKLETMQSAGKTAADIAKVLGTSRNAVIGRSRRLRGIVYQSDIDSWTRANARRSAEAHKRSLIRRDLQGKIVAEMLKSIASGVPREKAMERAFKAGAYWWQIGEHFGMSQQTAYETVKRAKKKRARK
jgi:DNA-binding CsgD family transcriptional regulator